MNFENFPFKAILNEIRDAIQFKSLSSHVGQLIKWMSHIVTNVSWPYVLILSSPIYYLQSFKMSHLYLILVRIETH